jgi:N-acetylglucosamine kinase-like BadF-type ATPase
MTSYFLGLDVGSTKTHALIADETGRAVGLGHSGAGNQQGVGYDGTRQAMQDAFSQALAMAGLTAADIHAAGFGISGYDWPSQLPAHQEVIATLGLNCPCEVVNDAVIGLLAGAAQGWGVGIVAGTGNNVRGRDRQGREGRITGEGSFFGEFGGSGELAALAIRAVTYEWTQRGPHTALSNIFIAHTGARDLPDLIEGIDLGRYRWSAEWARLIVQAAQEGDAVARDLLAFSGRELAENACAVIRQLQMQDETFEVVLAGSLFKSGDLLIEPLRQTLLAFAPHASFTHLTAPPVVGGVILAMQQTGLATPPLRPTLLETASRLIP